jgi:hypothetical protein
LPSLVKKHQKANPDSDESVIHDCDQRTSRVLLQPDIRQTSKKEDAKARKDAPQRNNPTRTCTGGSHGGHFATVLLATSKQSTTSSFAPWANESRQGRGGVARERWGVLYFGCATREASKPLLHILASIRWKQSTAVPILLSGHNCTLKIITAVACDQELRQDRQWPSSSLTLV